MEKLKHGTFASMISDSAFKRCFGTEEFKKATIGLLNSIIVGAEIIDVEFDKTEHQGLAVSDRKGIIDVVCKTKDSSFIIEMQKAEHSHFQERTVFYSSLYILNQIKKGEQDFELKDTFVISFLNFNLHVEIWKGCEYCHHFVTSDKMTREKLRGSTEFLFFELKRFNKTKEECSDNVEKWLYLLKHSEELDELPPSFVGEEFQAFAKAATLASYTTEEMIQYEKEMITELDRKLELKETRERAYAEGMEQGEVKGRAEGRAEGKAEGKAEIGKALLASGMSADEIVRITGLPKETFC